MIEIGFGTSEYTTHILTVMNTQGVVLWEGFVDGKEVTYPTGELALVPEGGHLPPDLIDILSKLPTYHSKWKEAWEDVTYDPSRLIASESVVENEQKTS